MRAKAMFVCLLLLPSTGSVKYPFLPVKGSGTAELARLRDQGNELFRAMRFLQASEIFAQGYQEAIRSGDKSWALRFRGNIGGCHFALGHYRKAMQAYLETRKLAESTRDWELAAGLACNISSLYLQMGELNAGIQEADRALSLLRKNRLTKYKAELLAQSALLNARQGDMETAVELFQEALQETDGRPDKLQLRALAWDLLGYEFLQRRALDASESALLEAFRIRTLNSLPDLQYSYFTLGMLRLAQGDPASAVRLLDLAVAAGLHSPGTLPLWRVYYQRGRARMLQGELTEALADFQTSLDYVRRWRVELLPVDSFLTSSGVEVAQVYGAFIEAANRLYFQTGNPALVDRAFRAAEENRDSNLRALLYSLSDWQDTLPLEYWECLARLRRAETSLLRQDTPAGRRLVLNLLYRLGEMEAAAGLDLPSSDSLHPGTGGPRLIARTSAMLGRDEALLSFHLGQRQSFVWALTRSGLQVCRLPSRGRIATRVKRFRRSVRLGLPDSTLLGEQLFRELFGALNTDVLHKAHWLLALDDVLFELPFAALAVGQVNGQSVYLIERHSVQITPAASVVAGHERLRWNGPFVGVGDAVYNTADPRWPGSAAPTASGWAVSKVLHWLSDSSTDAVPLQMTRLAGSGREIHSCARVWGSVDGAIFLEGMGVTRERLRKALEARPSVVHFATHFAMSQRIRSRGVWPSMGEAAFDTEWRTAGSSSGAGQSFIGLGIRLSGEAEFLSPAEISRWRLPLGLVVLSGCSSGSSEALPGSGLMGMTRAWMAAGARCVIASLWPVPDDSGELFASFYTHLRTIRTSDSDVGPADALRRAQLDMLRSGTWRSLPKYWAAYFAVEKE